MITTVRQEHLRQSLTTTKLVAVSDRHKVNGSMVAIIDCRYIALSFSKKQVAIIVCRYIMVDATATKIVIVCLCDGFSNDSFFDRYSRL